MINKIQENIEKLRDINPLTHCITNFVTVNDCANSVIAIGGSPIMSNEIDEACEIGNIANSVLINIGTLTKPQIETMNKSGENAEKTNTPFVLDPVGVGISEIRNKTTKEILQYKPQIIRGNISEIKAIANLIGILEECTTAKGVDAAETDIITEKTIDNTSELVKNVAKELNTTLAVSGPIDIISNGEKTYQIRNGDEMLSKITGSGCMLGCIIASYLGITNPLEAAITGTTVMGISGEKAIKTKGTGTFRVELINELSKINPKTIEQYSNLSKF